MQNGLAHLIVLYRPPVDLQAPVIGAIEIPFLQRVLKSSWASCPILLAYWSTPSMYSSPSSGTSVAWDAAKTTIGANVRIPTSPFALAMVSRLSVRAPSLGRLSAASEALPLSPHHASLRNHVTATSWADDDNATRISMRQQCMPRALGRGIAMRSLLMNSIEGHVCSISRKSLAIAEPWAEAVVVLLVCT